MATLSDDPREAVAQAQKDARALEAAKMFQASQDRRSLEGLGYLLPVDFPTKESGAIELSGARPAVPQVIKDITNFVTQTGAGAMGKAPPMAPEDMAMGMLDFTGAGILASTPARMAAKQTGDTILGTAGGTVGSSITSDVILQQLKRDNDVGSFTYLFDDEMGADVGGEILSRYRGEDLGASADPIKKEVLSDLRQDISKATKTYVQDTLNIGELQPDDLVSVFRVGDVKPGRIQSFSLRKDIEKQQLPGQRLRERQGLSRQPVVEYKVPFKDIIAAPQSIGIGIEREFEVLINSNNVAPIEGIVSLSTTAEKKSPFGLNPPVISQFKGDYLERPQPKIGKLAPDYSPVYNSLLDPKTLGFSPSVSKKSLTGEQIIARLKNQESVTKDELAYLGLENSLVKKDKYSLEDVRTIVRASEPEIHIKSSSLDDMNPDFELSNYNIQRIIPEGQERDYIEYVFQDQRGSLPSVKNMEGPLDEVEFEVLNRLQRSIMGNSAQRDFSHYTDLENVIGHARVAKIDSPFDARDNAIVIEEIQSDLVAASNPKTNRMGDKEYATPEKLGQAIKEAQEFYKKNPKVKEIDQEIINTRKELEQAKEEDDVVNIGPLTEKIKSLNESIGFSYDDTMGYDMKYARPEFADTRGAKRISRAFEGEYRDKTGIFSNLIQNPPFSTNKAAARYFMQNVIKDAVRSGTKTILLPDYVDLAKFHDNDDVKGFKLNYTDVFDKLISDYKKQGMRLKTGTVDISDDFSRKLRPMKYVTFLNSFDDIDRSLIRRYSKGGKVDIKGGIGAMAPTHM